MSLQSDFYKRLSKKRNDSPELQRCVINTVEQLSLHKTSFSRPGMLLGKIQSGKTRAFIGVIAQSFDTGYDIVIVLTKGTIALAEQTYKRLLSDCAEFVENDEIMVKDIMHLDENLTGYELEQKIIIVVKKQTDNLKRIIATLMDTYPNLSKKRILIIDDEADYASIGFKKTKEEGIELRKIAGQIDELRKQVKMEDFLQVTATPYSLYLQPTIINDGNGEAKFESVRPAFTELVPIHGGYIGGEFYFEESSDPDSIASHIYEEVDVEELEILKEPDRRTFKVEEVLVSKHVKHLRKAIVNFIVGGIIRRMQQAEKNQKQEKYSFTIHTEFVKRSHEWQYTIVDAMKQALREAAEKDTALFNDIILDSYGDIISSVKKIDETPLSFAAVKNEVIELLVKDHLTITKVNSEIQIIDLLDEKGQLKLRAPLNVFIGGQILDRGITISNLIGFYYGRRPKKSQQDTVLQHSRMFGSRPMEDMAVTRFYTSLAIYEIMQRIHEYDTALREAFENEAQDEVVFIHKDPSNRIVPCAPSKIAGSNTTTLRPHKRMLPIGFKTDYKYKVKPHLETLDAIIDSSTDADDFTRPVLIDVRLAKTMIELVNKTYVFDKDYEWDVEAFIAGMEYMSRLTEGDEHGKVWLIVRKNRQIKRIDTQGKYENAPDTPKGEQGETKVAREKAQNIPSLIMLRQNGEESDGWQNTPFWWPVLVAPRKMGTVIFASDLIEE